MLHSSHPLIPPKKKPLDQATFQNLLNQSTKSFHHNFCCEISKVVVSPSTKIQFLLEAKPINFLMEQCL